MIKYIKGRDVDEQKWNACVNTSAFPLIYGNVWYLDLVCHEWDALIYGDYEAVLPLPYKTKLGLHYLYRPYGVQQLGVFGDSTLAEALLDAIPKKFVWTDIFLNAENPSVAKKGKFAAQQNLILDLNRSYEQIYEGYSSQTRRNLKKAKKTKFSTFGFESPEALINLFKQNKGSDTALKESHYKKMTQIMHTLMHKNLGYISALYVEPNHLCAGVFFMEWQGRITFLFSAADDLGKENHAMTKILDEFFILQSGKPLLFDFEGSNIPNLARFYKGFGAEVETYQNYKRNLLPIPGSIIQKLF